MKGFSEESMLDLFGKLLGTVPFSTKNPGITALTIRAVDSTQSPLEEHDLRAAPATPEGCVTLAKLHEHFDCSYEVRAHWDCWSRETGAWKQGPLPVEIICNGEAFDDGAFQDAGHFQIDLGLAEAFLPDNSSNSNNRRSENVRALYRWVQQIRETLPVERYLLCADEEENFEAQLDATIAKV